MNATTTKRPTEPMPKVNPKHYHKVGPYGSNLPCTCDNYRQDEIAPDQLPTPSHTPGPWKIMPDENGYIICHGDTNIYSHVARLYAGALCPEHGNLTANARLIAAAPELLAVANLLDMADGAGVGTEYGNQLLDTAIANARAAIAKAEGRDQ